MVEHSGSYQSEDRVGLEMLVQRLSEKPDYMAWVLERYRQQEGLSPERLREHLEVTPEGYIRLALCLRPEPERFGEHVRQIEEYTQVDGARLANLVRQVDALDKFDQRAIEGTPPVPAGHRQPLPQARPVLRAARDRLHEDAAPYGLAGAAKQAAPASQQRPEGESTARPAADGPTPSEESPDDASHDKLAGHGEQ